MRTPKVIKGVRNKLNHSKDVWTKDSIHAHWGPELQQQLNHGGNFKWLAIRIRPWHCLSHVLVPFIHVATLPPSCGLRLSSAPLPSEVQCPSPKSYPQTSEGLCCIEEPLARHGSWIPWSMVICSPLPLSCGCQTQAGGTHPMQHLSSPSHSSKEIVPLASVSNLSKNAFIASSSTASV